MMTVRRRRRPVARRHRRAACEVVEEAVVPEHEVAARRVKGANRAIYPTCLLSVALVVGRITLLVVLVLLVSIGGRSIALLRGSRAATPRERKCHGVSSAWQS